MFISRQSYWFTCIKKNKQKNCKIFRQKNLLLRPRRYVLVACNNKKAYCKHCWWRPTWFQYFVIPAVKLQKPEQIHILDSCRYLMARWHCLLTNEPLLYLNINAYYNNRWKSKSHLFYWIYPTKNIHFYSISCQ